MTLHEAEVERIVVEVIRRLRAMESSSAPAGAGPVVHDLVLTDRVITMQTIDGRLAGVQRLLVPANAVVTPAVKDELKQRKIELIR
jgi:hypothetical protein